MMCLNIGALKIHKFSFGTNGKLMVSSVLILKHFRVYTVRRPVFYIAKKSLAGDT